MKALALDTSISCISVAAKNDDKIASLVLDIGMRQSEKLLPAIDAVLHEAELEAGDLDYTVLCEGPGSFTGLRLSFSALKAIELFGGRKDGAASESDFLQGQNAAGENENLLKDQDRAQDQNCAADENSLQGKDCASRIPVYGINSLDFLAHPFLDFPGIVLPVIDAHKEKFYAKAFLAEKEILACDDYDLAALEEKLLRAASGNCLEDKNGAANENVSQDKDCAADTIFVCGLEAKNFILACAQGGFFKDKKLVALKGRAINFESLFILAEEKIRDKKPPLKDYDGPQYFRASEAERNAAR